MGERAVGGSVGGGRAVGERGGGGDRRGRDGAAEVSVERIGRHHLHGGGDRGGGGGIGMVTMEDVLEEIVSDISEPRRKA